MLRKFPYTENERNLYNDPRVGPDTLFRLVDCAFNRAYVKSQVFGIEMSGPFFISVCENERARACFYVLGMLENVSFGERVEIEHLTDEEIAESLMAELTTPEE
ncbi:hypothetical protein CMI47_11980 [Candidatus Pacearchaeota archaeon]|nr:hypothetical protein [Candidatus Pacearchaeota archaeon]